MCLYLGINCRPAKLDTGQLAIILLANLADNLVHRPPIKLVIAQDLERQTVLDLILLDSLEETVNNAIVQWKLATCLERVITISGNPFIDGQQE